MKIYIIAFVFVVSCAFQLYAQEKIEIDNQTPGWLSSQLSYSQQQEVEAIKVTGYINQLDVNFLRELTSYSLKRIDLYDANIVKYEKYKANTIYEDFFNRAVTLNRSNLDIFILPKTIEKVEKDALNVIYTDTLVVGYKVIASNLPHYKNSVGNIVLLDGIEKISGVLTNESYTPDKSFEPTMIISPLPASIKSITGTINPFCFQKGINLPAQIEQMGTIKQACMPNSVYSGPLRIALQERTIVVPSNCKIINFGDYCISADTLILPEKMEYIRAVFDVKNIICQSAIPPTIATASHYLDNGDLVKSRVDTIYCPHGCGEAYKETFKYNDITILELPLLIESILFNSDDYSVYVNEKIQLVPNISPLDAENTDLTWKSSDETIVKVDSKGNILGVNPGSAIITATSSNGVEGSCKVNVLRHVEKIEFDHSELVIDKLGESILLRPQVYPSDASDKSIIWKSSSPDVCHISNDGVATALNYGIAIITATSVDGGHEAYCKISIEKGAVLVSAITLNPTEIILTVGDVYKVGATVQPQDADNKNINWSSTNPTVATVDGVGNISAIAEGNAIITAQASDGSGITATCNVSVEKQIISISSLSFVPDKLTLHTDEQYQLVPIIMPDNATNKNLIWSSTNKDVVTVENTGVVTTHNVGTSMIIAATTDGSNISAICSITVDNEGAISTIEGDQKIHIESHNGTLSIVGCRVGDNILIYSIDGQLITQFQAYSSQINVELNI